MKRQTIVGALAAVTLAACQGGDQADVAQEPESTTLPAQTTLVVSLGSQVSSETNRPGDTFHTTLTQPILVENQVVLAAGTAVMGRLSRIEHLDGGGTIMELRLTEVHMPGGDNAGINTGGLQLVAEGGSVEDDLEKVAIGGVAGGILGAAVGGAKGAAVGAAVGAGAGTVVAVATRGDDAIVIPAGQKLQFVLAEPADIPLYPVS